MSFDNMNIDVIVREHANMTSFRYGTYFNNYINIHNINHRQNQPNVIRLKLNANFLDLLS